MGGQIFTSRSYTAYTRIQTTIMQAFLIQGVPEFSLIRHCHVLSIERPAIWHVVIPSTVLSWPKLAKGEIEIAEVQHTTTESTSSST